MAVKTGTGKRLLKVAVAAAGIAALSGVGAAKIWHDELHYRQRLTEMNNSIASHNQVHKKQGLSSAQFVPIELHYRNPLKVGRERKPLRQFYDPNKDGFCSAYVTRVAELFFGKKYEKQPTWDLPKVNKVVLQAPFSRVTLTGGLAAKKIKGMIRTGKISPGTIIACYYKDSPHNRPERDFTHSLIYMGEEKGHYWFWHNYHTGPDSISLEGIYSHTDKNGKRDFFPVAVIVPPK